MSHDIGKELEELNVALLEAEERFIAYGTGTRAEIVLEDGANLLYSKEGGGWGLSVATKGGTSDLMKANMRHRVLAAHALDEMEKALLLACDERVKEIRAAVLAIAEWNKRTTLPASTKVV